MAIEAFIQHYGYAAVLVGTFLEGETVLVLGGFASHRGYLELPWVLAAAFAGTLCGDQLFFFLGRRYHSALLRRRPSWEPRIARARQLIGRHRVLVILSFRFLYGLRTVTPFALGMSDVPFREFLSLNAVGAAAWTAVIGGAGYLFGKVLELFLENVRRYELLVFALLAGIGALVWLIVFLRGGAGQGSFRTPARSAPWARLEALPKTVLLTSGVILVLFLGGVDLLTGAEFSTEVLYLIPICLATWLTGRWGGAFISLASALTWLAADIGAGSTYSHSAIPYWNVFVRLLSFLLVAYLFAELRVARERRRDLESIFFHDISNVLGTIRGAAQLLQDPDFSEKRELYDLILAAAEQACDELDGQKILTSIENHELHVSSAPITSRTLLEQVAEWYRHHEAGRNRIIELDPASEEILFESDPALISRVLGNMIKNALEAAGPGEKVTAGCAATRGGVEFRVHNPGVIPEEARKGIFERSVSSKGKGRGLGTYSMRLLSEQIGGRVSFASSAREGTVFRAWYPLKPV